jgi:hypothetical protein
MVFGIGRKDARDEQQQTRERRIPYKLASYEHDVEGKRFKSSNVVFSFWSAAKYVLILSLILWWLPMFGQMIAGYVGGRRAGGPWKGVAAAIIPVVGIFGVMTAFEQGWLPSHIGGVAIAPAAIGAALSGNIPLLSPYLQFSQEYVGSFVDTLAGASPYGINTYVLTVAFAYVGGVLAEQNRREIGFSAGSVTNHTTVLMHDPSGAAYEQKAPQGFFSGIGGLFHLGGSADRGESAWADGGNMRYYEGEGDIDGRQSHPAQLPAYDGRAVVAGQQGHGKHRHHHHHHEDPWKQKRRGAPNFHAKPRFDYPQYQDGPRQEAQEPRGGFRRRDRDSRFTVSTDPRSIKRARKAIDDEWGRRRSQEPAPRRNFEEESEAVAVEREPEPQQHHREHHPHNQWDTI